MHNLCFFFVIFSKITFYWKFFSDCCDQFGYPGSIVYLSCFLCFFMVFIHTRGIFLQIGLCQWVNYPYIEECLTKWVPKSQWANVCSDTICNFWSCRQLLICYREKNWLILPLFNHSFCYLLSISFVEIKEEQTLNDREDVGHIKFFFLWM